MLGPALSPDVRHLALVAIKTRRNKPADSFFLCIFRAPASRSAGANVSEEWIQCLYSLERRPASLSWISDGAAVWLWQNDGSVQVVTFS